MSVVREYDGPLSAEDYAEIEEAVLESARGRRFLAEYAKRQRSAETWMLLEAIHRLESRLESHIAAAEENSAAMAPLSRTNLQYFRHEEELFMPTPELVAKADRPALRVVGSPSAENSAASVTESRASRVVIRRVEPAHADEPSASTEEPASQPSDFFSKTPDADKQRIVVIRRAPFEQIDIPLADENADNAVA